jgi:pyruvate,orthophosphate dikinase
LSTDANVARWVYDFSEGSRDMRALLGGKGANVAEMTRLLGADRVPAGFTITTDACVAYMRLDRVEPGWFERPGGGRAHATGAAGRKAAW